MAADLENTAVNIFQAVVLGIVEGLTEFLPVSSTGHLTIVEKLMGLAIDDAGVTAFTAIIQTGAILAVIIYFWRDIVTLITVWVRGFRDGSARASADYRLAWAVIIGSIPIGIVGFLAKDYVAGPLRNLWVVAAALVVWSAVMYAAEKIGTQQRSEDQVTLRDALIIGALQCVALIPGVSRSGATISAGLFVGLNRVAATRLSFFLSIPALVAAGGYEAATSASDIAAGVGWLATAVATAVSFVVAYASIAWLLRFVSGHPITYFVGYRLLLASALIVALAFGMLTAV
ncbi:undecaprenyl-diphosphate phosphatase [soil metagenome]